MDIIDDNTIINTIDGNITMMRLFEKIKELLYDIYDFTGSNTDKLISSFLHLFRKLEALKNPACKVLFGDKIPSFYSMTRLLNKKYIQYEDLESAFKEEIRKQMPGVPFSLSRKYEQYDDLESALNAEINKKMLGEPFPLNKKYTIIKIERPAIKNNIRLKINKKITLHDSSSNMNVIYEPIAINIGVVGHTYNYMYYNNWYRCDDKYELLQDSDNKYIIGFPSRIGGEDDITESAELILLKQSDVIIGKGDASFWPKIPFNYHIFICLITLLIIILIMCIFFNKLYIFWKFRRFN
jgi:hypothetical protein